MQIVLNSELKESEQALPCGDVSGFNYWLQKSIPAKLAKGKEYTCVSRMFYDSTLGCSTSGLLGVVSEAYAHHRKLEIGPHDIWYLLLCELASVIKDNVEALRDIFSKSKDKVEIIIGTDNPTKIDIQTLVAAIIEQVPSDISCMIAEFSTSTEGSRVASYAALCDGLQVYYNYSTMLCGIPEIRITGTNADWTLLYDKWNQVYEMFIKRLVDDRFMAWWDDVHNIIHHLNAVVGDQDIESPYDSPQDFLQGIFTSRNVGSGGELEIDGWITDLYYKKPLVRKLHNFPSSIATVPFKNFDTGRQFIGVYGALHIERTSDNFIRAKYSSITYEVKDSTQEPTKLERAIAEDAAFVEERIKHYKAKGTITKGSVTVTHVDVSDVWPSTTTVGTGLNLNTTIQRDNIVTQLVTSKPDVTEMSPELALALQQAIEEEAAFAAKSLNSLIIYSPSTGKGYALHVDKVHVDQVMTDLSKGVA